ncbi:RNA recognition motif-containing protein [Besnoitia besnoiti]|uniref:RNA recognition motif-containing protein n=1 Tax=Besnoitia besnoiti TaxID=94643 RepID=A0A2A9MM91_BESBE|nr:RNA recognition motif-containing protein [Besnoitia besnoiti]PFH36660.1 RNA recognition motif-containing protein [Besnoitia besnoiti]
MAESSAAERTPASAPGGAEAGGSARAEETPKRPPLAPCADASSPSSSSPPQTEVARPGSPGDAEKRDDAQGAKEAAAKGEGDKAAAAASPTASSPSSAEKKDEKAAETVSASSATAVRVHRWADESDDLDSPSFDPMSATDVDPPEFDLGMPAFGSRPGAFGGRAGNGVVPHGPGALGGFRRGAGQEGTYGGLVDSRYGGLVGTPHSHPHGSPAGDPLMTQGSAARGTFSEVYVGELDAGVTEDDVTAIFVPTLPVRNIRIVREPPNRGTKGPSAATCGAFVTFHSPEDAQRALGFHGKLYRPPRGAGAQGLRGSGRASSGFSAARVLRIFPISSPPLLSGDGSGSSPGYLLSRGGGGAQGPSFGAGHYHASSAFSSSHVLQRGGRGGAFGGGVYGQAMADLVHQQAASSFPAYRGNVNSAVSGGAQGAGRDRGGRAFSGEEGAQRGDADAKAGAPGAGFGPGGGGGRARKSKSPDFSELRKESAATGAAAACGAAGRALVGAGTPAAGDTRGARGKEDAGCDRTLRTGGGALAPRGPVAAAAVEGEETPAAAEPPRERPKLVLKPRTKPLDSAAEPPKLNPAIFGAAKPIDDPVAKRQLPVTASSASLPPPGAASDFPSSAAASAAGAASCGSFPAAASPPAEPAASGFGPEVPSSPPGRRGQPGSAEGRGFAGGEKAAAGGPPAPSRGGNAPGSPRASTAGSERDGRGPQQRAGGRGAGAFSRRGDESQAEEARHKGPRWVGASKSQRGDGEEQVSGDAHAHASGGGRNSHGALMYSETWRRALGEKGADRDSQLGEQDAGSSGSARGSQTKNEKAGHGAGVGRSSGDGERRPSARSGDPFGGAKPRDEFEWRRKKETTPALPEDAASLRASPPLQHPPMSQYMPHHGSAGHPSGRVPGSFPPPSYGSYPATPEFNSHPGGPPRLREDSNVRTPPSAVATPPDGGNSSRGILGPSPSVRGGGGGATAVAGVLGGGSPSGAPKKGPSPLPLAAGGAAGGRGANSPSSSSSSLGDHPRKPMAAGLVGTGGPGSPHVKYGASAPAPTRGGGSGAPVAPPRSPNSPPAGGAGIYGRGAQGSQAPPPPLHKGGEAGEPAPPGPSAGSSEKEPLWRNQAPNSGSRAPHSGGAAAGFPQPRGGGAGASAGVFRRPNGHGSDGLLPLERGPDCKERGGEDRGRESVPSLDSGVLASPPSAGPGGEGGDAAGGSSSSGGGACLTHRLHEGGLSSWSRKPHNPIHVRGVQAVASAGDRDRNAATPLVCADGGSPSDGLVSGMRTLAEQLLPAAAVKAAGGTDGRAAAEDEKKKAESKIPDILSKPEQKSGQTVWEARNEVLGLDKKRDAAGDHGGGRGDSEEADGREAQSARRDRDDASQQTLCGGDRWRDEAGGHSRPLRQSRGPGGGACAGSGRGPQGAAGERGAGRTKREGETPASADASGAHAPERDSEGGEAEHGRGGRAFFGAIGAEEGAQMQDGEDARRDEDGGRCARERDGRGTGGGTRGVLRGGRGRGGAAGEGRTRWRRNLSDAGADGSSTDKIGEDHHGPSDASSRRDQTAADTPVDDVSQDGERHQHARRRQGSTSHSTEADQGERGMRRRGESVSSCAHEGPHPREGEKSFRTRGGRGGGAWRGGENRPEGAGRGGRGGRGGKAREGGNHAWAGHRREQPGAGAAEKREEERAADSQAATPRVPARAMLVQSAVASSRVKTNNRFSAFADSDEGESSD